MPRGGARPGAGRKRGGLNEKNRNLVAAVVEAGVTPLEVMLAAMRKCYDDGDLDRAAEIAKDAAPYVHPRLSALSGHFKVASTVRVIEDDNWYRRIQPVPHHAAAGNGSPN